MYEFFYTGPERRKHKRINKRMIVNIQIEGRLPALWEVVGIENISESGMMFNHYDELPSGMKLHIRMSLFSEKEAIRCVSQVVHSRKLGDLSLYEMGILFVEISPQDQKLLRETAQNFLDYPASIYQ